MPKNKKLEKDQLSRKVLIEGMAAAGMTKEQIAIVLEMHEDSFKSHKNTDIELVEAYDRGKIRYLGEIAHKEEKWVPDLDRIEELSKSGIKERHIAGMLGLTQMQFAKKKEEFPEIEIRINRGQAITMIDVVKALILMATIKNNPLAAMFLAKTIGDFNDQPNKVQHEISGNIDIKSTHVFVAPEMLNEDEFQAMIERSMAKRQQKAIAADADTVDVKVVGNDDD